MLLSESVEHAQAEAKSSMLLVTNIGKTFEPFLTFKELSYQLEIQNFV